MEEEKSNSKNDADRVIAHVNLPCNSIDGSQIIRRTKLSIKLIRRIGVGGFSDVYLGRIRIDDSGSVYQVAIKQIAKTISNASVSYQRELYSLRVLSKSPYIIKFYGLMECNNYFSLLLGYGKYGDLCDFVMKRFSYLMLIYY